MSKAMRILLAVALAGAAASAAAQTHRNEVSVFGSWDDVDEPENVEVFNLNLRYGRFVSPRLLGTATLSRSSFEGGGVDSSSTSFLVGAKYYFGQPGPQQLVPFVDGAVGVSSIEANGDDGTDLTWEFGGGVALFLTERTSIDGSLRLYNTDTDARTKGIRAFLGLTTRF